MIKFVTLNKKNIENFAKERNKLLDAIAKGKSEEEQKKIWVFFVDTDEVILPELAEEIMRIDKHSSKLTNINGFYVTRKIMFLNHFVGKDSVLRMARLNSGRWKRAVHETWEIEGETETLQHELVHNTANNLREYVDKINKYAVLHAKENIKEGKKTNIIKIILYPQFKLLYEWLILGRSFIFALMQSLHSFLTWTLMYFYS